MPADRLLGQPFEFPLLAFQLREVENRINPQSLSQLHCKSIRLGILVILVIVSLGRNLRLNGPHGPIAPGSQNLYVLQFVGIYIKI